MTDHTATADKVLPALQTLPADPLERGRMTAAAGNALRRADVERAARRRRFTPRPVAEQVEGDARGAAQILARYGLRQVGTIALRNGTFAITLNPVERGLAECIYAFVFGDAIQRIGSSKGPLDGRMSAFSDSVSKRWAGIGDPDTPPEEAAEWRRLLEAHRAGTVWARAGHTVDTPVGRINAYLAEESALLARWKPPLNRSLHR